MDEQNLNIFHDTMSILTQGYYFLNGRQIRLKLSFREMETAFVYLPKDVNALLNNPDNQIAVPGSENIHISCANEDSFTAARKMMAEFPAPAEQNPVLVLNLANAVHPGGGVRRGASAQEEDLCRKSSLLISLEGRASRPYYKYNQDLKSYMGSDAVIITPQVQIIKDENGMLLEDGPIVAVMTCAAPCIRNGREGMSEQQYEDMVYNRIRGMLLIAASLGYDRLVLGAFGCGAFGNDAHVVSELFRKAMKNFVYNGKALEGNFRNITFAVLDRSETLYNFTEFSAKFNHYYEETAAIPGPEAQKRAVSQLDAIRGSLFGGAVGDALGYAVEFWQEDRIFDTFGPEGITDYQLENGTALISDDTQMTLFTANGILAGSTYEKLQKTGTAPSVFVAMAYQDWLKTQRSDYHTVCGYDRFTPEGGYSWLLDVPELYSLRAPGNTCLSALERGMAQTPDYMGNRINNSKGCGGIMRVAPMALAYRPGQNVSMPQMAVDLEGAQIAAITHGHPLGYIPAAVVTHIISRILTSEGQMPLKDIYLEARDSMLAMFRDDPADAQTAAQIINHAIALAENNDTDLNNIHALGEGWVAEETMGIALYCALKYRNDFSKAMIVSVNHNGDSDSTGAVTGNILGALVGYENIEDKWKENLELSDVILEMASDLYRGCPLSAAAPDEDPAWYQKYVCMQRYRKPEADQQEAPAPAEAVAPAAVPYTFFWIDSEENGWLSNWYRKDFVIDDFVYMFVEQYMMAQKARLFHDAVHYTAILRADTPSSCKKSGKEVTPFDPEKWDAVKYEIVKTANRAKYEQNPELKKALLATGDSIIAEASPKDFIWGIGMTAEEAQAAGRENWPGENLLGRILMELREEFRQQENENRDSKISVL